LISLGLFPGYCIDTSAFVDLWRISYPPDVFQTLWKRIDDLISEGRLIAPREVFKELEKRDDELLKWTRKNKKMFKDLDPIQIREVQNILNGFPDLVDPNKTTPDADPFVISLAITKGWSVVTSENPGNPGGRPKIPDVCEKYKVSCLQLIDFFRKEKWEF